MQAAINSFHICDTPLAEILICIILGSWLTIHISLVNLYLKKLLYNYIYILITTNYKIDFFVITCFRDNGMTN